MRGLVFRWVFGHSVQRLLHQPAPQNSILLNHCEKTTVNDRTTQGYVCLQTRHWLEQCGVCFMYVLRFSAYPVILCVMILTPVGDSPIALKACLTKSSSMYGSSWTQAGKVSLIEKVYLKRRWSAVERSINTFTLIHKQLQWFKSRKLTDEGCRPKNDRSICCTFSFIYFNGKWRVFEA